MYPLFKSGIANTISSFEWRKNIYIYKKIESTLLNKWTDWLSIYQNYFVKSSDIF